MEEEKTTAIKLKRAFNMLGGLAGMIYELNYRIGELEKKTPDTEKKSVIAGCEAQDGRFRRTCDDCIYFGDTLRCKERRMRYRLYFIWL